MKVHPPLIALTFALALFLVQCAESPRDYSLDLKEARALVESKAYGEARGIYNSILSRDPSHVEANYGLGYINSMKCFETGELCDSAEYYLKKAFRIDSCFRNTAFNLSLVYHLNDEDFKSLSYIDIAIHCNPTDPDYRFQKAAFLLNYGDTLSACACLRQAKAEGIENEDFGGILWYCPLADRPFDLLKTE